MRKSEGRKRVAVPTAQPLLPDDKGSNLTLLTLGCLKGQDISGMDIIAQRQLRARNTKYGILIP